MSPKSILNKGLIAIYGVMLLIGFLLIFILPPIGFVIVLLSAVLLVIYAVFSGRREGTSSKPERRKER
ncbi:MAG: hypothetical protein WCY97_08755 [Methanothrix sp.]|jgi:4-hydroxybenzoate polyprenyltransferase|nr:MAG: hypothetical protein APR56_01685 [Methanosaeta sp. SDB]MCP1391818.1 hypothetical protein [Methanothrix harundinacea]MDD3710503.1 hypothetical protein [Methanothrix sp.]MDD5769067.1 hypothetical protein [Methanothrix sp.]MDI9398851.1 hypothetical protein [Euryarchaeota archaeon]